MQICRAWRTVALATPRLWRNVDVPVTCKDPANILDTFAERAYAVPLHVEIWAQDGGADHPREEVPEELAEFAQSLRRHAPKVESLVMTLGPFDAVVINAHTFDFARLCHLRLDLECTDLWRGSKFIAFRNTAELRSFVLHGTPPVFIDVPWAQLTELKTEDLTLDEAITALRLAPNVTHASLIPNLEWHPAWSQPIVPLIHPLIRHLDLTEAARLPEGNGAEVFGLMCLTLPALESLVLDCTIRMTPQIFSDFLRRSAPPLRSLTFKADALGGLQRWDSMEPFVGLKITSLTIELPPPTFTQLFLGALGRGYEAGFLPALESLSMHCDESDSENGLEQLMSDVGYAVQCRRYEWQTAKSKSELGLEATLGSCPLRSLRLLSRGRAGLVFDLPSDSYAIQTLQSLEDQGLDIYAGTADQRIF
nr:predicted protein [Mycena chlorophos]